MFLGFYIGSFKVSVCEIAANIRASLLFSKLIGYNFRIREYSVKNAYRYRCGICGYNYFSRFDNLRKIIKITISYTVDPSTNFRKAFFVAVLNCGSS